MINTRFYRWYGWDGAHDSLWSQSVRPLLDPREMNASAAHVAGVVREAFSEGVSGRVRVPCRRDDETVLVDVAKALAAFQETLVSARTPFDDFRDALERERRRAIPEAQSAASRSSSVKAIAASATSGRTSPTASSPTSG